MTSILSFARIFIYTKRYYSRVLSVDPIEQRDFVHTQMMEWAGHMLKILKISVTVKGTPVGHEPVILVGNHVSYLDIPLLMSLAPVVFVAKRQISTWPVFGPACRSVGTLFVDRDNRESRLNVAEQIAPEMQRRRQSVVLFPSGTTCDRESKPWKWGAFQIAKRQNLMIQPFRIRYRPMRRAAYLMEDTFAIHLFRLITGGPLEAVVEFHEPFAVSDPQEDARKWWEWAREGLEKSE